MRLFSTCAYFLGTQSRSLTMVSLCPRSWSVLTSPSVVISRQTCKLQSTYQQWQRFRAATYLLKVTKTKMLAPVIFVFMAARHNNVGGPSPLMTFTGPLFCLCVDLDLGQGLMHRHLTLNKRRRKNKQLHSHDCSQNCWKRLPKRYYI